MPYSNGTCIRNEKKKFIRRHIKPYGMQEIDLI